MQSTAIAPAGLAGMSLDSLREVSRLLGEALDSVQDGDLESTQVGLATAKGILAAGGVGQPSRQVEVPKRIAARLAWAANGFLKFHSDYYRAALRRVLAEVKLFRDLTDWERRMA